MRPLTSHCRAEALTTLATVLKQTKEARVFRRAQAVREVVAGHHVNAVSALFHCTNAALRKWVPRFAQQGLQGLRDRPRTGRPRKVTCPSNSTSTASSIKTRFSMVPVLPRGVVAHAPWSWPSTRAPNLGVKVSAGCEKTGGELLSSYRAACSRPGGSRLRFCRTGGPRGPGPSGRNHPALCRRNGPVALCPAPRRLVAQSPAGAPCPYAPCARVRSDARSPASVRHGYAIAPGVV